MKKLILLAICILWASPSMADNGVCRSERGYIIKLTQYDQFGLRINPSHSAVYDTLKNIAFVPLWNEWVSIETANPAGGYAPILIRFDDIEDCSKEASEAPIIPMNECLGISASAVNMPESGVFMIDGYEYAYNGNLSFLVPLDMFWQWELYHEGVLILRFEQSEDAACHIVESETP